MVLNGRLIYWCLSSSIQAILLNDHGYVLFVVTTAPSFFPQWFITDNDLLSDPQYEWHCGRRQLSRNCFLQRDKITPQFIGVEGGGVRVAQSWTFCVLYWSPLLIFLSFYLSAIVLSVPPCPSEALYHYRGYLYILVHNSRLVIYVLIFQNKTSISLTLNNLSMTFCRQVHHKLLKKNLVTFYLL